ncbi:protein DMP2-like [Punica granatum]|uniref:Uncharacterized protein n=2 Tax=Punica granatum TaxID=22663 RepID=A0A218X0T3_PUNGR|nr:protein DMP2-like [Punica granatum]OWM78533.1 hypothetical protein CDL15_Pgr016257 [Punica granatum]PKI68814.1 hypothetical protein CRG98_010871 [Punica granatum]
MAAQIGAALGLFSAISSVAKKITSAFSKSSTTTSTTTTSNTTSSSSSSSSSSSTAFSSIGDLIKLLPAGTVFLFQYLSPITTNNGTCSATNKVLTSILIAVCGISCLISSFTDSYTGSDGSTHYGIATFSGLWPSSSSSSSSSSSTSLSSYRLRFKDFVHALTAVIIFAILSLLDTNTVKCFYPSFLTTKENIIKVLPIVIGSMSSTLFVLFPSSRNGIGSASSSSSSSTSSGTSSGNSTSTA